MKISNTENNNDKKNNNNNYVTNYTMFEEYPDVVSIDELQKMLRIGRNSIYDLLKSGLIKTVKIGKKYIIPKRNVIEFLNTLM